MKKLLLGLGTIAAVVAPVVAVVSCGDTGTKREVKYVAYTGTQLSAKNTMFITDGGKTTDQSFNQSVFEGATAVGLPKTSFRTPGSASGIGDKYTSAIADKNTLIVASGFNHGSAIKEFSQAHSDEAFLWVDGTLKAKDHKTGKMILQGNVASIMFNMKGISFIAGIRMAYYSSKPGKKHAIGIYGGMNIPSVNDYISGIKAGIKYFNENKEDSLEKVKIEDGGYVGNFETGNLSGTIATTLVSKSDLVMAVGGPQFKDVLSAIKKDNSSTTKLVGVDVNIELTHTTDTAHIWGSVLKGLKTMTSQVMTELFGTKNQREQKLGHVTTGNMSNSGTGLVIGTDVTLTKAGHFGIAQSMLKAGVTPEIALKAAIDFK